MRSVDQNDAGNIVPITTGKQAHVVSAHGMADKNDRTGDSGIVQKCVQLFGEDLAGAPTRAGFAIPKAGTIVGTNARELRHGGLHFTPGDVTVAKARVEYHDGTSLPGAVDVHLISTNIDQFAGHAIETA